MSIADMNLTRNQRSLVSRTINRERVLNNLRWELLSCNFAARNVLINRPSEKFRKAEVIYSFVVYPGKTNVPIVKSRSSWSRTDEDEIPGNGDVRLWVEKHLIKILSKRESTRNRVTSGRDKVEWENQSAEEQMKILGFCLAKQSERNDHREMAVFELIMMT